MRTQEEIKRQVDGLDSMKTWLPEHSKFGTPNWEHIDAQIEVLNSHLCSDDLVDEDCDDSELIDAICRAEDWLDAINTDDLFEEDYNKKKDEETDEKN